MATKINYYLVRLCRDRSQLSASNIKEKSLSELVRKIRQQYVMEIAHFYKIIWIMLSAGTDEQQLSYFSTCKFRWVGTSSRCSRGRPPSVRPARECSPCGSGQHQVVGRMLLVLRTPSGAVISLICACINSSIFAQRVCQNNAMPFPSPLLCLNPSSTCFLFNEH